MASDGCDVLDRFVLSAYNCMHWLETDLKISPVSLVNDGNMDTPRRLYVDLDYY